MLNRNHLVKAFTFILYIFIAFSVENYRFFLVKETIFPEVVNNNIKLAENFNKTRKKLNIDNIDKNISYEEFFQKGHFSENITIELFDKNSKKIFKKNKRVNNIIKSNNILDKIFIKIAEYHFSVNKTKTTKNFADYKNLASYINLERVIEDKSRRDRLSIVTIYPIKNKLDVIGYLRISFYISDLWNIAKNIQHKILIYITIAFLVFFAMINHLFRIIEESLDEQNVNNEYLRKAKMQAETENLAKTDFLSHISHELRTPLNSIIGFSEIILSKAYGNIGNVQYEDYIKDINNSGKHLLSVINDILDYSKASADKLSVDSEHVDVSKIASSCIRFLEPRSLDLNITITKKFPSEHAVIYADPKRLKQAILNILSNAFKFTPENSDIIFEIEKDDLEKLVYIRIIDEGIGMTSEEIEKSLKTFEQIDNKYNRKFDGTGLGLPLTKKLVELMNGKLIITSKKYLGTTVTMVFNSVEDF